ncbi:MAG TPA: hypothetical protein VNE38_06085 [Ktedonobacteraceae bacterium]|nr:hypothetical protein [Ktedonobacteraceae bacterium]
MTTKKCLIFYSWQSDLTSAANKNFILHALESAAKALRNDDSLEIEPVIDRDTKGIAGSPDIAKTIFNKIEQAQVFVCDVSIINQGATTRLVPNPNVLVELGYAFRALGENRIILVMNDVYGVRESLPFDLRPRRIIQYHMPVEAESRTKERKNLEEDLKAALHAILSELDVLQPEEKQVSLADRARLAIEANRPDQVARVRDYMVDVAKRIPLITTKDASGELDEQLIQALDESRELVIEFAQLAKTIADMNAGEAAKAMYNGFAKILDLYVFPPRAKFTDDTIVHDLAKFLGQELFVSFFCFFVQMDRWETIANLLDEEFHASTVDFAPPELVPFYALSAPVSLLYTRHQRLKLPGKSLHANLLNERHSEGELADIVPVEQFMEADFFLFLCAQFPIVEPRPLPAWMPWSTAHMSPYQPPRFLQKAIRFGYAKQLMRPLGVEDVSTLRTGLQKCSSVHNDFWSRGSMIPWFGPLDRLNFNAIGSKTT